MPTNARPGFCTECGTALDPDDDRRECHNCTADVLDNDDILDEDLPCFDWRNSAYLIQPNPLLLEKPINWDLRPTPGFGKRRPQKRINPAA